MNPIQKISRRQLLLNVAAALGTELVPLREVTAANVNTGRDKATKKQSGLLWWQTGVIYQIYPRSFQDSSGDGIGDLKGVIQRLDYLSDTLGVDAIWISPVYPSPMHDFGYDVSNYTDIHPMFGTLADFDRLVIEAHRRGLKVLMDLVPNHTSDEHPWFLESRSSRNNPKRDWYLWRDPAPDGGVPNNWMSRFGGGSAWTYDERTRQYYLHLYLPQQPDLNYQNPVVIRAMLDVMRFWLNRGVDGFRVDVIWLMMKDPLFRDEPLNLGWDGVDPRGRLQHVYTADQPEVHDLIRKMRAVLDSYDDRVMVGEIYLPNDRLMMYYGTPGKRECHLPFNFQLIHAQWKAPLVRRMVDAYEATLPPGAWPNWVLGNHDQHRLATRVGPEQTRVANMLLLTLRGTPTCYYGDEIGMADVPIPVHKIQDPPALNNPQIAHVIGRDPQRTPMQWSSAPNADFASPQVEDLWLPLASDYRDVNVSRQLKEPRSMLNLFRRLLAYRKTSPALQWGSYRSMENVPDACYAYAREIEGQRVLTVLNFSSDAMEVNLSRSGSGQIAVCTHMDRAGDVRLSNFSLRGNEGLVIQLST